MGSRTLTSHEPHPLTSSLLPHIEQICASIPRCPWVFKRTQTCLTTVALHLDLDLLRRMALTVHHVTLRLPAGLSMKQACEAMVICSWWVAVAEYGVDSVLCGCSTVTSTSLTYVAFGVVAQTSLRKKSRMYTRECRSLHSHLCTVGALRVSWYLLLYRTQMRSCLGRPKSARPSHPLLDAAIAISS